MTWQGRTRITGTWRTNLSVWLFLAGWYELSGGLGLLLLLNLSSLVGYDVAARVPRAIVDAMADSCGLYHYGEKDESRHLHPDH